MDALRLPNEWTRLTALTVLGRSPLLFPIVARLGSGRDTLVTESTGLCIEAPPRSANSFFGKGFSIANPEVPVAHHHHVPAQVHRALELKVPVIALLRNPIDCALAKAAPTDETFLLGTTFRRWISFWQGVEPLMGSIVVARFEEVIADPGGVIQRINETFSSQFSTDFPPTEKVFEALEADRVRSQGAEAKKRPNPNIPNDQIKAKEQALRPKAESHPLGRRAVARYQSLVERLTTEQA